MKNYIKRMILTAIVLVVGLSISILSHSNNEIDPFFRVIFLGCLLGWGLWSVATCGIGANYCVFGQTDEETQGNNTLGKPDGKYRAIGIKKELKKQKKGNWKALEKELTVLQKHLKEIEKICVQYAGLTISNENEIDDIEPEMEEIMNLTEQSICKNIVKICNHLNVRDPEKEEDIAFVKDKLIQCAEDNELQLEQIRKPLYLYTDLINSEYEKENTDLIKACREAISMYLIERK